MTTRKTNVSAGPEQAQDRASTQGKPLGASGPDARPRILVVHREQFALDALAQELAFETMSVIGVSNLDELQACLEAGNDFEAAILDYRIFPASGIEQVSRLIVQLGQTPMVVFASNIEARMIPLLLQAGVRGVIPENMPLKAIASVLYLVRLGQVFTGSLPLEMAPEEAQASKGLTDEENAVLRRAAAGDTNKQIAAELGVTEGRVKMMMRAVCQKIAARNRAHACVIARELGVL